MYAAGVFLLSGCKQPRDGGVILATASGRGELQALLAEDPFHREGMASYEIVDFVPSLAAPALQSLVAG